MEEEQATILQKMDTEKEQRQKEKRDEERRQQEEREEKERRQTEQQAILQALEKNRTKLHSYIDQQLEMVDIKWKKWITKWKKWAMKSKPYNLNLALIWRKRSQLYKRKPVEISPAKVQRNAILKHYKVPKFDGESSWDLYRRQFEVAAMANGWIEH